MATNFFSRWHGKVEKSDLWQHESVHAVAGNAVCFSLLFRFSKAIGKRYARPDIAERYFLYLFFFEGGAVVGGLVLRTSRSLVSRTLL